MPIPHSLYGIGLLVTQSGLVLRNVCVEVYDNLACMVTLIRLSQQLVNGDAIRVVLACLAYFVEWKSQILEIPWNAQFGS